MGRTKGALIHRGPGLVDFWFIALHSGEYVGVVAEGDDEAVLTLYARVAGAWVARRKLHLDWPVRTSDARVLGGEVLMCTEVNNWIPIEFYRWSADDIAIPTKEISEEAVGRLELGERQRERVDMRRPWNVISPLEPQYWLFSPKFVQGSAPPQVIVDTSDGQAMLLSLDGPGDEDFAIPGALEPQAGVFHGQRVVAYKNAGAPIHPFWVLPRHQGKATQVSGALTVKEGDAPPLDLSAQLRIGPVSAFSLREDGKGVPWLLAVREAVVGSEIVALVKEGTRWAVKGTKALDDEVEELTTGWAKNGWHLVYSVGRGERKSVRWSFWEMPVR
jgi:hypothetical protein